MKVATVRYSAEDAPTRFVRALRETGFAILEDHPIAPGRFDQLTEAWLDFFRSEEKHQYTHAPSVDARSGYWPPEESETAVGHDQPDLKEFFQLLGDTLLPDALRDDILTFRRDALQIGIELLHWIDQALAAAR